jgi:hypothetical protein
LLDGIYFNYANYSNASFFFADFCAHLALYLFKRDDIREWLVSLRQAYVAVDMRMRAIAQCANVVADVISSGVKLFLLTNAYPNCTHLVCDYVLGPDWPELFDLNMFYGRKPRFWTQTDEFHEVVFGDGGRTFTAQPVTALEHGKFYQCGNVQVLTEYMLANRPLHRYVCMMCVCVCVSYMPSTVTDIYVYNVRSPVDRCQAIRCKCVTLEII